MKNKIVLDFCIWDFDDITPEVITQILDIQPVQVYIKGQKTRPNLALINEQNGWRMTSGLDEYTSFEEQMNSLLDILEQKHELLKPLCDKYICEFSCALFIAKSRKESTPWVHLNSRYNRFIKELNIEFDIDIYLLPG